MHSHKTFKFKPLSVAVASSLMALCSQSFAQDSAPVEEVLVTGIRASLERAMDVKRDSAGVVDAITAEDIGKFPDTNLAESLQRISGVSIDRRNGEGYQVTVRGFGPQFNLVTLNGRTLPSSQLTLSKSGGGNASGERSFDMSNIAAEGVSGVQVYKTGQANISSGGIGATVNLETRKPMDQEGFVATVAGKGLYDTTNRINKDWTPEVSSFLSWSNDMFGASAVLSHQERNSGESGVFTNGYSARSGGWTDPSMIPETPNDGSVNVVDAPTVGQQTNFTEGVRYYHGDRQRTRENAQITLQYRPIEALTATLDYTYAEQDIFVNSAELSFWFGGGTLPTTDVDFDGGSQVATIERLWSESPTQTVRDIGITQNQGHAINTLKSTGFNLEYLASDTLTLVLDAHNSTSTSLPGNPVGNYFNIGLGAQGNWAQGYDNSGDLPLLVGIYDNDNRPDGAGVDGYVGNVDGQLDVGDLGSTVRQGWNARSWSETTQIKLDGKWEFNDSGSIDFGLERSSFESTQKVSSFQEVLEGNWGVGTPGDVPPYMMEELDYSDLFDGYSTSLSSDSRAFFDQAGRDETDPSGQQAQVFTTGWIAKDVNELGKLMSYNAGLDWAANPDDGTNRTIKEDITALYIQGSYKLEIADMPLNIHAGIRYESTDTKSIGQVAASTIVWQGDNDLITRAGNAADAPVQTGTGSYSHVLPNLSLSLEPMDDFIVRAAYSKTIARPSYGNMLLGINGVGAPNGGPTLLGAQAGTASTGSPELKPLESNNYDISVEWYYGDASYASIGYFIKDVPNFVGNGVAEGTVISDVFDQTNGPRAQAAFDKLIADGIATADTINSRMLFQMMASMSDPASPGCVNNFGDGEDATNSASCGAAYDAYTYEQWEDNVDLLAVDGDPAYIATLNYPVDTQSAKLDGWELAIQHFFGESGFGVQANYTIVNGDIEYVITDTSTQFALTGLSDSANLVGIYEYNDWSVRLAYNWRDDFLVTATEGGANQPRQTEAYSQFDLNVNYTVTDNFTVAFEGINITGEDQRDYGRTESQVLRLDILGPRYAVSGRYTF